MLEELSKYAVIIIALGMVNVVYQLEKANKYMKTLQRILLETRNE
jgi:hypothetical protein